MRFAIVESGGKQYRAIEGRTIEVDRLALDAGKKFDFEHVLLMADGDEILVGTPTISDILVKVTVLDHVKGPKIDRFRYRPKKRIRVRGGHRQQFTRLLVDFIGRPDETRPAEKAEPAAALVEESPAEEAPKARAKKAGADDQGSGRSEAAQPAARKASAKPRSSSKKTDTKKK
jgi:large subunit ribosomal protein L21